MTKFITSFMVSFLIAIADFILSAVYMVDDYNTGQTEVFEGISAILEMYRAIGVIDVLKLLAGKWLLYFCSNIFVLFLFDKFNKKKIKKE